MAPAFLFRVGHSHPGLQEKREASNREAQLQGDLEPLVLTENSVCNMHCRFPGGPWPSLPISTFLPKRGKVSMAILLPFSVGSSGLCHNLCPYHGIWPSLPKKGKVLGLLWAVQF